RTCGTGVCRSGIHRRGRTASGCLTWHRTGGGQTYAGQTRLCPPAPSLGDRAQFRLGGALPTPRPRLRTIVPDLGRMALRGLRLSHARSTIQLAQKKLITGSRGIYGYPKTESTGTADGRSQVLQSAVLA